MLIGWTKTTTRFLQVNRKKSCFWLQKKKKRNLLHKYRMMSVPAPDSWTCSVGIISSAHDPDPGSWVGEAPGHWCSESHQCYDSDFWAGAAFYSLGSVPCSGPHPLLAVDPLSCSCGPKPSTASCCDSCPHSLPLLSSGPLTDSAKQSCYPTTYVHPDCHRGRTPPVLDLPRYPHSPVTNMLLICPRERVPGHGSVYSLDSHLDNILDSQLTPSWSPDRSPAFLCGKGKGAGFKAIHILKS